MTDNNDPDFRDILGSGLKRHTDCFPVLSCSNEVKWVADITRRIGFTANDRLLFYVNGGAAWANASVGMNQSIGVTSNLGPTLSRMAESMAQRARARLAAGIESAAAF